MPDPQPHDGARRAFALACGVSAGTYVYSWQRRRRSVGPSTLANLSARQAMTVAAIANVIGLLTMAVFAAYCVAALCQL